MNQKQTPSNIKPVRTAQVLEKAKISRTQLYRLLSEDRFPKPFKLSHRICVWNEADIDAWISSKYEEAQ